MYRHPAPILAIDVGSTAVKAARFTLEGDQVGEPVLVRHRNFKVAAGEIAADAILLAFVAALNQVYTRGVEVVATSVLWQGVLAVDIRNRPLSPVLTWEAAFDKASLAKLRGELGGAYNHIETGSWIHSSYPLAAMTTLPKDGTSQYVDLGGWLIGTLTGTKPRWSEVIAAGSGAWDQHHRRWSSVLSLAGIDPRKLGTTTSQPVRAVVSSHMLPNELRTAEWLPAVGDGLCHNLGAAAVDDDFAVTAGTSGSVRAVTEYGQEPIPNGLWRYRCGSTTQAVGGAITSAGNSLEWVRNFTNRPIDWSFVDADEPCLTTVEADTSVYGRRGPDYPDAATGALNGLGPGHTLDDVNQAFALDSWKLYSDLFIQMTQLVQPSSISMAGGVADHDARTVQLLADALDFPVATTNCAHPSLRGAALYAASFLRTGSVSIDNVVDAIREGRIARPLLIRTALPRPRWTSAMHARWRPRT